MPFTALAKRRSSLFFSFGLCCAAFVALLLDDASQGLQRFEVQLFETASTDYLVPKPPRPLENDDLRAAARAWQYFEQNTQSQTGLVDSVAGFASTTLWDQGSYLFSILSAKQLGLITHDIAEFRGKQALNSFKIMPLFQGRLPNKAYNTRTLAKTDYANTDSETGIGWSALDIARLLLALRALEAHFPSLSKDIQEVVARWDLEAFASQGELWGMSLERDKQTRLQEGRLGYEQYGARAAALWGLDVGNAMSALRHLEWVSISDVEIPADTRYARSFEAITPILSEPYLLQAFEMGFNQEGRILAHRIYAAQESRFDQTGIPTMVSEDHLDQTPNFAYSSVYSNATPWAVVDEKGNQHNNLRTLSTKAVFGWHAIYETDYTVMLMDQIRNLSDEGMGWPAGIYEADQKINKVYSLNTNAVVLEAIHYKAFGPILHSKNGK